MISLPWIVISDSHLVREIGSPLLFIGAVFMLPTGIVTTLYYFHRAKTLDKILSGKELLVHWTYTETEWKEYAKQEFKLDKEEKTAGVLVVGSMSIAVGIVLAIIQGELAPITIMVGISLFVAVFLALLVLKNYIRNWLRGGEAFIGPSGVYLNPEFHSWTGYASRFQKATLKKRKHGTYLDFLYSAGGVGVEMPVLVPAGKEQIAEKVIEYFQTHRSHGRRKRKTI
jgi:hypothetical protein